MIKTLEHLFFSEIVLSISKLQYLPFFSPYALVDQMYSPAGAEPPT